ncbi:MAG TPA: lipase family protein [Vicinamibacteria bacterium]|nr:lipase family protein [Vicinamibacteria bacterium]
MQLERLMVASSPHPFPIYADAMGELLRARSTSPERDPVVAHILGVLAGYAYGDTATVATMASRLGMAGSACLRIVETVDAMYICSTAYLLQSRCGRVGILCYRGTELGNLANWLGNADVGSHAVDVGGAPLSVHAGFHRNVRATRWPILESLHAAARGESIMGEGRAVDHPLEALYVTGHSLGGAMAVLFALLLGEEPPLADKLRAVYTFGQPLTVSGPLPVAAATLGSRVFRHVYGRDIIPSLPPTVWGPLAHFGHEFHYGEGQWHRRQAVTAQLTGFRAVPGSLLGMFAPVKRRDALRFTMADHLPHHYIAALRPAGRVSEFGDRG